MNDTRKQMNTTNENNRNDTGPYRAAKWRREEQVNAAQRWIVEAMVNGKAAERNYDAKQPSRSNDKGAVENSQSEERKSRNKKFGENKKQNDHVMGA